MRKDRSGAVGMPMMVIIVAILLIGIGAVLLYSNVIKAQVASRVTCGGSYGVGGGHCVQSSKECDGVINPLGNPDCAKTENMKYCCISKHPMGGGEGRSSGGRHPCTPWGMPTKGYRTRKNTRSDKYIVKRRSKR